MKSAATLSLSLGLLLWVFPADGQQPQPPSPPIGAPAERQPPPPPPPPPALPLPAPWNVRVEFLMVETPQAMALTLLPDLHDSAKVEQAYASLLAAIGRKEARLIAYPIILTKSGEKATSETIEELIYPTQFQPPDMGHALATPGAAAVSDQPAVNLASPPTNFEKRNTGATVEVEPVVRPDGAWIDLNIQPQRVIFEGFDWFEALRTPAASTAIQQPRFYTTKVSSSYAVRNSQWTLVGFHKLYQPDERIELDLVRATATPTGGPPPPEAFGR